MGPEKAGGALVWHVLAKQAAATLCGQQLRERMEASDGERARHCPDCMASFEKRGPGAGSFQSRSGSTSYLVSLPIVPWSWN
ncbi:hypothetical protein, partial [Streptomyces sp. NPDC044948]|uniref:hypothetical protein n=1 Tax=Streptomyces sp. NPDC044948 TaxID=3157092 RepID=UPI0033E11592